MKVKTAQSGIGKLIACQRGRPRIAGAGVSVRRVAACHRMGMEPEEIIAQYPHLNLAQVHAALSYYYSHRREIDGELADESRTYDELARAHRRVPATAA